MTPDPFSVTWIAPEVPGLPPLAELGERGQIAEIEGVRLCVVAGPSVTRAEVARALRNRTDVVI